MENRKSIADGIEKELDGALVRAERLRGVSRLAPKFFKRCRVRPVPRMEWCGMLKSAFEGRLV